MNIGGIKMSKKLVKSTNNKMLFGVCAGVADQLNVDPTIVRVVWAIAALVYGTGILIYIICAIVFPEGTTNN